MRASPWVISRNDYLTTDCPESKQTRNIHTMLFHNCSASVPDVGPTVFQHCVNSQCKPSHTGQAFPTAYRTNKSVKSRIPQGSDGLISPYSCAHLGQVHVEMGLTCIDFQSRPPQPPENKSIPTFLT